MKNISKTFIVLLFVMLVYAVPGSAQESTAFELEYEVQRIYPSFSITREKLESAQILSDLNEHYQASWIKAYKSVEIVTRHNGKYKMFTSKNDILSQEQKEHMKTADAGAEISVTVSYIPDNNLKQNDTKEMNFTLYVDPDKEARFPGGEDQLKHYLKVNAIDKISETVFRQFQLAAVKFTINKSGQVSNVHLAEPSGDDKTDELLLETILNMPTWKPAEYANGLNVDQEFVLLAGDMESCVLNLFNIRQ